MNKDKPLFFQMQDISDELAQNFVDTYNKSLIDFETCFDIFSSLFFIKILNDFYINDEKVWQKLGENLDSPHDYMLYDLLPYFEQFENENIQFFFKDMVHIYTKDTNSVFINYYEYLNTVDLTIFTEALRYSIMQRFIYKLASMMKDQKITQNLNIRVPILFINLMQDLLKISASDKVCDLTCGNGFSLLGLFIENGEVLPLDSNNIWGMDLSRNGLKIAILSSFIMGLDQVNFVRCDLIQEFDALNITDKFDKVLAVPPIARIQARTVISESLRVLHTKNTDIMYLEAMMASMKENATAIALVPQDLLSSRLPQIVTTRKKLIESFHVISVINFNIMPGARVALSLIWFQKTSIKNKTCFINLYSRKARNELVHGINNTVENNDALETRLWSIRDFLLAYNESDYLEQIIEEDVGYKFFNEETFTKFFDAETIKTNDYVLNPQFYQAITQRRVANTLDSILEEMQKNLNDGLIYIDKLKQLILNSHNEQLKHEKEKLGNLCELQRGKILSMDEDFIDNFDFDDEVFPFVKVGDTAKVNNFILLDTKEYVNNKIINDQRLVVVPPNTLLLPLIGSMGTVVVTGKKVCIDANIIAIHPRDKRVDQWYLLGWFIANKSILESFSTGSGIPRISRAELENLTIEVPNQKDSVLGKKFVDAIDIYVKLNTMSKNMVELTKQMPESIFDKIYSS